MSAAAVVLFATSALMFGTGPVALLVAKVRARRDSRAEAMRRAEQDRQVTPEWLALLNATTPSLSAHPAAERIRERIAANEAARIDDEWKRWTA